VAQDRPVISYGLEQGATWMAENVHLNSAGGSDFLVVRSGQVLGEVRLRVPGAHNVLNALAAIVVADHLGVPFPTTRSALREFRGVARRFEVKDEVDGVTVIDDYAHHPTEIRATLKAAHERFAGRELWAVWQPHTYSRTKALFEEFTRAFDWADHVLVLPIYASREHDGLGVSSTDVILAMSAHPDVRGIDSLEEAVAVLGAEVSADSVVMTLGAGDGNLVGDWLLVALKGEREEIDVE
jgi:UDP-N-acetylmuramate--alanine ligase